MRFANWEKAAKYCEDTYGIWVDWGPEFTADQSLCPICEFNFYD